MDGWIARLGARVRDYAAAMQIHVVESLGAAARLIEQRSAPVLILTDLSLTDANGTEVILRLRELAPQSPLLVVTALDDPALRDQAEKSGAIGYILKSSAIPALRHQIGVALQGHLPRRRVKVPDTGSLERMLTPAQIAVLAELASGRSNKEISASLKIGEETVSSHVKEILARLAVRNRTQAVVRYMQLANGYRGTPKR